MRTSKLFTALCVTFGFALSGLTACTVDYGPTTFRCNPKEGDGNCPDGFQCCSDDPAEVMNTELFSNQNNALSSSGMCVDSGVQAGLANGCPVPCNPTWSNSQIEAVCGPSSMALCCQTTDLEPEDCIFDVAIDCFRPVNGTDTAEVSNCPVEQLQGALQATGYPVELARCNTAWRGSDHITHQDPAVAAASSSCNFWATQGIDFGLCVQQLTVADQRGFCLQKAPDVQLCPAALSDAQKIMQGIPLDGCAQLNMDLGLTCG